MTLLKRGQKPILAAVLLLLAIFSVIAFQSQNYEFIIYIVVILVLFFIILMTNRKADISNGVLWGLFVWAFLHMAGGMINWGPERIYSKVLLDIFTIGPVTFFRYDHLVHLFGFGVATYLAYEVMRPYLRKPNWIVMSVVFVLIGMGLGVVNELIEFLAVVILQDTGVGGYENTLLDMFSNTLGAIIAVLWINWRRSR